MLYKLGVYRRLLYLEANFVANFTTIMESERIKSPEGLRKLMEELWTNHFGKEKWSVAG